MLACPPAAPEILTATFFRNLLPDAEANGLPDRFHSTVPTLLLLPKPARGSQIVAVPKKNRSAALNLTKK
jgi:hypothetical protein